MTSVADWWLSLFMLNGKWQYRWWFKWRGSCNDMHAPQSWNIWRVGIWRPVTSYLIQRVTKYRRYKDAFVRVQSCHLQINPSPFNKEYVTQFVKYLLRCCVIFKNNNFHLLLTPQFYKYMTQLNTQCIL